jgi:hypothetical protein
MALLDLKYYEVEPLHMHVPVYDHCHIDTGVMETS